MAASVEATFKLIDRASSTLNKITAKAELAQKALDRVGDSLDKLDVKLTGTKERVDALNDSLGKLGTRRVTPRIDLHGATAAIAQAKAVDSALDAIERKTRARIGNNKGGIFSRLFGALPNFGNSNIEGMFGSMASAGDRLTRAMRPLGVAMGGVGGAVLGVATALPPMVLAIGVALPAIIALTGAVVALGASLIAAVGGLGVVGAGLFGAFALGIGSIALVAKDALGPLKAYTKASQNLQKALSSGDPRKIQAAQKAVDDLAKAHPGVARLRGELDGVKKTFEEIAKPARARMFDVITNAVHTARTMLPNFASDIRRNVGAAAGAVDHLLATMQSRAWQGILHTFSRIFQGSIGPMSSGIERIMRGIGHLVEAAEPQIKRLSTGFAGLALRFEKWSTSKSGQKFVVEMVDNFKQWLKLIGAVANVLGALTQSGARPGRSLLKDLTDWLNKVADWLRKHPKALHDFFDKAIKDTKKLADILGDVATTLFDMGQAMRPLLSAFSTLSKHISGTGVLAAVGAFLGFRAVRGGIKGAKGAGNLFDRLGGRGSSPANPIFVASVGGPGLPGRSPTGRGPGPIARIGRRLAPLAPIAARVGGPAVVAAAGVEAGRVIQHHTDPHNGQGRANAAMGGPDSPIDLLRGVGRSIGSLFGGGKKNKPLVEAKPTTDALGRMQDALGNLGKKSDTLTAKVTANDKTVKRSAEATYPAIFREMQTWASKMGGSASLGVPSGPHSPQMRARGGRIPGVGRQDTVFVGHNTMAAPGELIVNRHTERRMDAMLSLFGTSTGREVSHESRPHFAATGTRVGHGRPLSGPPTPGLREGIASAVSTVLSRFPALSVTSTTGGKHAGNSYHYRGMAADLGGSAAAMNQAAAWIGAHMGRSLTEGIHNPNLSIAGGRRVPPGHWGPAVWAQHANHIHLAVAGALGALMGDPVHHMRHRRIAGVGMGQRIAQRGANRLTGRAQRRLNAVASMMGGGDTAGGGLTGAGGQFDKSGLAHLWRQAGGDPSVASLMAAIALAESGGNPRAHNPSGASGLWQILGTPFPGNVWNPLTNARMAVSKYGSQGLGAWEAYTNGGYRHYMSQGGRVPFGGWFGKGGEFTARRPTFIGVGDREEHVKITPANGRPKGKAGIHVEHLVVHGGDAVKDEVLAAFRQLAREVDLLGVEED